MLEDIGRLVWVPQSGSGRVLGSPCGSHQERGEGRGGPGGRWAWFTPSCPLTASAEQLLEALSALPQDLGWGSCPSYPNAQGALTAPSPCRTHPDMHAPWSPTRSRHFTDTCIDTHGPHVALGPTGGLYLPGLNPASQVVCGCPSGCVATGTRPSRLCRSSRDRWSWSGSKWKAQRRGFRHPCSTAENSNGHRPSDRDLGRPLAPSPAD